MASVLEIIPLGGIGEFGMNCMAVRYGDEMLILDAGMGFPEEVCLVAQDATTYRVEVNAGAKPVVTGSYTLKLTQPRPPFPAWAKTLIRSTNMTHSSCH